MIKYLIASLSCVLCLVSACAQDSNANEKALESSVHEHQRISLPPVNVDRLFEIPDDIQKKSDAKIAERTDYWLSEIRNPGWEKPTKASRTEIDNYANCIAEQEQQFREKWNRPKFKLHEYSLHITEWTDNEHVGFVLGSNSIDLPLRNSTTFFLNFSSCRLIFVDYELVPVSIYENSESIRPIASVIWHDPRRLNSEFYVNNKKHEIVRITVEKPGRLEISHRALESDCGAKIMGAAKGDRLYDLCSSLVGSGFDLWATYTLSSVSVLEFDHRQIQRFKSKAKPKGSSKSLIGLKRTETYLMESFVTRRDYDRGERRLPVRQLVIQKVEKTEKE